MDFGKNGLCLRDRMQVETTMADRQFHAFRIMKEIFFQTRTFAAGKKELVHSVWSLVHAMVPDLEPSAMNEEEL